MGFEPIENPWIKVVHHFPVESVSSTIVEVGVAVGNASGNLLSHPERCEDVVFSADDKTWCGDVTELIAHVVIDAGCGLPFETVKWLGIRICVEVITPRYQSFMSFIIIPERFGEDKELNPFEELLVVEVCFANLHVFEYGRGVAIALGPRTHKDGTLHFLRMAQAELLRDYRSHRNANNAGLFDTESIHESGVVIGHHFARVISGWFVGLSNSAVVGLDAPVILRSRNQSELPRHHRWR